MNRLLTRVACFCLFFGILGRELSRSQEVVIEPVIAVDSLQDDEYSDESVETFIVGQKRKYAISEETEASIKRPKDTLSTDSVEFSDFDTVYAELLQKPSTCDCSAVPRDPEDRRLRKSRLRVASFNAEWLFLFGGRGSVKCPGRGCPWQNLKMAKNHFSRVVSLIAKLDADILHLNEVEDCRVLEAILRLLPTGHGYRAYMTPGTDTMTGQNVALLTRIDPSAPITKSMSRVPYPIDGSTCGLRKSYSKGKARSGHVGLSKHYLAQFDISLTPGKPTRTKTKHRQSRTVLTGMSESKSVFYGSQAKAKSIAYGGQAKADRFTLLMAGAHFIAQPGNADRCLRREAQATVLNRLLQGSIDRLAARHHPWPVELLITGDFNDHDRDAPGASGELPISNTLQVLKRVAGRSLFTAASWISRQSDRYSSWHDRNANCVDDGQPEHSLIDHVLLSEGLRRRLYSVWMDHNETVSCTQRTSDHFPIIFEIN